MTLLDLYEASLESALAKYDYLPGIVALRQEVARLLRAATASGPPQTVNQYLAEVNTEAHSGVLYGLKLVAEDFR